MNGPTTVDVPDLIDGQKVSGFQIRVLLLCAAVVFMDGFDAQAIGYVAPVLSKAWKLKPGALKDVFAAGLFGLMLGALVFGPIADRVGRKAVIILCTIAFSVFTLLTITSSSLVSLFYWRLLTGFGLGGAMPNAIALTSEYSPHRRRAVMVMIMFCGFSLGSALGGFFAAWLIPVMGWTGVFWVGGLFPLLLVPFLILALPESIRLLALKGTEADRIRKILGRINATLTFGPGTTFAAHEGRLRGFAVRHLFRESRALGTILIWIMFFMNLLNLYFLASWLPTVIHNTGISMEKSAAITSLLQIGGTIGTFSFGWLFDRLSPFRVLASAYFVAGFFIAGIGMAGASVGLIILTVFGAGFCIVGAQIGANAMAAGYYPTAIRSTGVGWAPGIGRIGSIVGPWVGGLILSFEWRTSSLFLTAAIPALLAALAASIMAFQRSERAAVRGRAQARKG
jgi:AAHS family 4-hydroxybenzoate transporter-like MFS transporter